ncbi:unnamed protein product [Larinioides sclopetarius]|uniref:Uncharacterized protein n=1 Tax=Larinioides sclopetarius TaxID=280406 RepID=A0AAV1ZEF7_9ARAC
MHQITFRGRVPLYRASQCGKYLVDERNTELNLALPPSLIPSEARISTLYSVGSHLGSSIYMSFDISLPVKSSSEQITSTVSLITTLKSPMQYRGFSSSFNDSQRG